MPVAGLRGTGDFGTDERPKSFRELILFRNPGGNAPIFALSGRAGKKVVRDPEHSWWDEPNDIVRLQVNGALGAGDTTIVVDSLDPDATVTGASRVYGTAGHLKPGDLLMVDTSTAATYELMEVTSVQSDTQFTVTRGVAGTTAGAIGDNAFLTLVGSAYAEGTGAPRAASRNPVKWTQYTQIFKDTYELSKTADATTFRTGDPWSLDKKRKMFDHARNIEMAILFGKRHEVAASMENGLPKRYMGGLLEYIPSKFYTAAVTADELLTDLNPVFDYDTEGGDTRIMFLGNGAAMEIGKIVKSETAARMELGNTVRVFGMQMRELITTSGRFLLKTHPLLSRHGIHTKSAVVVDFASLKYIHMEGRDTKAKDDVQNPDEDVRRGLWLTEAGIEVSRGGQTMKFLGNISAT